jgi:hypothetical protein
MTNLVRSSVQTMQAQIKRNAGDPQQTSVIGIRGKYLCPLNIEADGATPTPSKSRSASHLDSVTQQGVVTCLITAIDIIH